MNSPDNSRKRILDAAALVLQAKGYKGTTLGEIAKNAGMLAPSLYYHFSSKEKLVEEVMLEGIYHNTRYVVAHVERLGVDVSARDRLRAAIVAHVNFLLTYENYSPAVTRTFEDLPIDIKDRVIGAYSAFDNTWRDLIVAVRDAGSARNELDPTLVRKFLIAMLNSCVSWYREGKLNPDQVARQAADLFTGGFLI